MTAKLVEKLVPELRFPGFSGEWEPSHLKAGVSLVSGQHLAPNEYSLEKNGVPYFTGPSDYTNNETKLTKWTKHVKNVGISGDVLITVKGSGVGTLLLLKLPSVALGRQLMAIRSNGFSARLVFQILSTKKQLFMALASGNMIPGLSRPDILSLKVCFPKPEEQEKIAGFLSAVDERIGQLTRKKELLEQYKKAVMQQIFSRQLRFKSPQGTPFPDWEEKQLGDLLSFKNGLNGEKNRFGKGTKFISVLDIINNRYISYDRIIGRFNATKKEEELYSVSYGDILFQRSSETREEVGQSNVYLDKTTNSVFGGFVIRGKMMSFYNPEFLNYLLKSSAIRKEITTRSGGSTRYNIGQGSLSVIGLKLPGSEEQQKIASFLTSIDQKIEAVQTQLAQTLAFKKGLLQQMFV